MAHEARHLQHSGRGGAGNTEVQDVHRDMERIAPPELRGKYTTGRGGEGNIMKNDLGPEAVLEAQGYEDRENDTNPDMLAPSYYSGRGGAGSQFPRRAHSRVDPSSDA